MESMRKINRVMEREIKKGSTPLKLEQVEMERTATMKSNQRKSCWRCFPICYG